MGLDEIRMKRPLIDARSQRPVMRDERGPGLTAFTSQSPQNRIKRPSRAGLQLGLVARPPAPAHALATVLRASLTAFDRSPKPASGRLKGSSPFDGSLRPDEPPDGRGPLDQRQALRQLEELAPGKAGRYH